MNPFVSTCAAALLASTLVGQSYYIPDNNAASGGANVIPFGHNLANVGTWGNQIYQQVITAAELGNPVAGTITELAFAPQAPGIRHFSTIEITLAQTNVSTLSTTFSANLTANVQTVLKATNYAWDNTKQDTWNRIGLDKSYLYLNTFGANLVIQIQVTGAYLDTTSTLFPGYRTGARQRVYAYRWTGSPPATGSTSSSSAQKVEVIFGMNDLHAFGVGCAGSNAKTPRLGFSGSAQLGQTFSIDLSDALASAVLLHVVGVNRLEPAIDLQILSAPKCFLYESVDFLLAGVTDGSGAYAFKTAVPKDNTLIGFRIYTQYFPMDQKANNWGYTASNYGRILPGN